MAPGIGSPGRVEITMFEHSEQPSPSMSSTPVTARRWSPTAAGRASPDETARRTRRSASGSGWRSRNVASCAQKVGTPESTVTSCRATRSSTLRTVGRTALITQVAPSPRGRKNPLPKPSDANRRATEWQRSPGSRASMALA